MLERGMKGWTDQWTNAGTLLSRNLQSRKEDTVQLDHFPSRTCSEFPSQQHPHKQTSPHVRVIFKSCWLCLLCGSPNCHCSRLAPGHSSTVPFWLYKCVPKYGVSWSYAVTFIGTKEILSVDHDLTFSEHRKRPSKAIISLLCSLFFVSESNVYTFH